MTCLKITESQNGQIYPEDTFSHGAAHIISTLKKAKQNKYVHCNQKTCANWSRKFLLKYYVESLRTMHRILSPKLRFSTMKNYLQIVFSSNRLIYWFHGKS